MRAYRYSAFDDVAEKPRAPERRLLRPQLVALEMLGLEPSATLLEIKARYKELVKRYHPDANGGDRGAEERLKQVIKAYGVLRASGLTLEAPAPEDQAADHSAPERSTPDPLDEHAD